MDRGRVKPDYARIKEYISGGKAVEYLDRLSDRLKEGSFADSKVKSIDARLRFLRDYIGPAIENPKNGLGKRLKNVKGALQKAKYDWPNSSARKTVEAIDEILYGPVIVTGKEDAVLGGIGIVSGAEFLATPLAYEIITKTPMESGIANMCYAGGSLIIAASANHLYKNSDRVKLMCADVGQMLWNYVPLLR